MDTRARTAGSERAAAMLAVAGVVVVVAACGTAGGGATDPAASDAVLYGEEDGLGCHERADGEEFVESAVYDHGDNAGFESTREQAVAIATGDVRVPGGDLVREVDGDTVRLVDVHGHVQAVVRLGSRDGGFRVEELTACSPG